VVIAIIAILAAILFPVFISAKAQATKSTCLCNARQIGIALSMYKDDNHGDWPTCYAGGSPGYEAYSYAFWMKAIKPYARSRMLFRCPAAKRKFGDYAERQ